MNSVSSMAGCLGFRPRLSALHEHLVRYVGWYSNRARGERAKTLKAQQLAKTPPAAEAAVSEFATRAKATWARLIRKVYEADPLVCPKCKGPMRVIALIDDPGVVRRILEHPKKQRGQRFTL